MNPFDTETFVREGQDIDFSGLELLVGPVHQERAFVADPGLRRLVRGLDHAKSSDGGSASRSSPIDRDGSSRLPRDHRCDIRGLRRLRLHTGE